MFFSASDWKEFRDTLAQVETGNKPYTVGDGGRAYGRWQMHPAWVMRYADDARVDDTWDSFFERALKSFFFDYHPELSQPFLMAARRLAQAFHVGHMVSPGDKDWDKEYDEKFIRALPTANDAIKSSV